MRVRAQYMRDGAGGHIASSQSSAFGAPPLRFGRFAVTAPAQYGSIASMGFDPEIRPEGPDSSVEAHGGQRA